MLRAGRSQELADTIARCVLTKYKSLPAGYKPRLRDNGRQEWTVLAGIVFAKDRKATNKHEDLLGGQARGLFECVSLATGLKCLPRSKIADAEGNTLHDWHAEVLCLRGLNRWLLDECNSVLDGSESTWVKRREDEVSCTENKGSVETLDANPYFELRSDTSIFMYISAAPCGDASMELIMAAQEDATPWAAPAPSARADDMLGRGHFDQLGMVRRKPSRPDAPSTWSKSCSDKLAAKQCTSLLSSVVGRIVHPSNMYLSGLVLPTDQYVQSAMERSFSATGRLKSMSAQALQDSKMGSGYSFRPFSFLQTSIAFEFAQTSGAASSNQAVLHTDHRLEILVNGVLQGRKQHDARGASCASRRLIAEAVMNLETRLGSRSVPASATDLSYAMLKRHGQQSRQLMKDELRRRSLQGWKRNDGDDAWLVSVKN